VAKKTVILVGMVFSAFVRHHAPVTRKMIPAPLMTQAIVSYKAPPRLDCISAATGQNVPMIRVRTEGTQMRQNDLAGSSAGYCQRLSRKNRNDRVRMQE